MVPDFFTKPLQGVLYSIHRNEILGINEDAIPTYIESYEKYRESTKCIVKP